jgi:hypothetical protein
MLMAPWVPYLTADSPGTRKSRNEAVTCGVVAAGDVPGVSASGGQGPGGTMEVLTLTIACHEGRPPADDIFAYPGCPQPVPP